MRGMADALKIIPCGAHSRVNEELHVLIKRAAIQDTSTGNFNPLAAKPYYTRLETIIYLL